MCSLITVKDYALSKGVSTQAIYQHINRYSNELKGHINKNNGKKYLDDEAIKFLDNKIEGNSIVVIDTEKNEELKKLQEENKKLLLKLMEIQDKALIQSEIIQELQTKILLLEIKQKKKWFWRK